MNQTRTGTDCLWSLQIVQKPQSHNYVFPREARKHSPVVGSGGRGGGFGFGGEPASLCHTQKMQSYHQYLFFALKPLLSTPLKELNGMFLTLKSY